MTQALYVGAQVGVGALFITLECENWPGLDARGGVLLAYPMGVLAERFGTPAAYLLPASAFAAVAPYGAAGARIRPAPDPSPA